MNIYSSVTLSKYSFPFQMSNKTTKATQCRFQHLIYSMDLPRTYALIMAPHLTQKPLLNSSQPSMHSTSSLYPQSNGFIGRQVKTIMSALENFAKTSKTPVGNLLQFICSSPIGSQMPSSKEIFHNRTEDCPGQSPRL